MLALLAAAAGAIAAPVTFKDWTVGCDNGRACQAVGLMPQDASDDATTVSVSRDAAAAAVPRIVFNLADTGAVAVAIDGGKPVPLSAEGAVAASAAPALASALANARRIELLDKSGRRVARVSPAGASAALRFIDDRQARAGTVTALVARGPGPASAVPSPPPLPVVVAARPAPGPQTPALTVAAAIKAAGVDTQCGVEGKPELTVWRLDAATSLLLLSVPCSSGAYNMASAVMLVDNRGALRKPLADWQTEDGMLINADWDAKSRRLTSYNKGRGLGDCGQSGEWVWTGARFARVELRVMDECRGSPDWIRTYRALVR